MQKGAGWLFAGVSGQKKACGTCSFVQLTGGGDGNGAAELLTLEYYHFQLIRKTRRFVFLLPAQQAPQADVGRLMSAPQLPCSCLDFLSLVYAARVSVLHALTPSASRMEPCTPGAVSIFTDFIWGK